MNVQAHVSGQMSGHVPNQTSNQLPGLAQHNGNTFHTQMQNLGGQSNPLMMDPEMIRLRQMMQSKIYHCLALRQAPPDESVSKKLQDMSKRLEEELFKAAPTKEAYMNMDTLESRLHAFIRRTQNHAPQNSQYVNTPTPVGTMIPTPGIQHPQNVNSNVIVSSSLDPSNMITTTANGAMSSSTPGGSIPNSNGLFPNIHGGSFHGIDKRFFWVFKTSFI